MLNNKDMNINELKDCIHYEVIGSERPFSWRKAIVRAINIEGFVIYFGGA